MYSLVFYTHSDYCDCWEPMFGQANKYFPHTKKYLIVNDPNKPPGKTTVWCYSGAIDLANELWKFLYYDQALPYQQRVLEGLSQIDKDECIIFHHEDMFLYAEPDWYNMNKTHNIITDDIAHLVKLCRASYNFNIPFRYFKDIFYYNPDDLLFAIQPTMGKVKNFASVYAETSGENIWKFEIAATPTVKRLNFTSLCTNLPGETLKGTAHFASLMYPYFATAIVKGKWNLTEYPELRQILEAYKVDPDVRGTNA